VAAASDERLMLVCPLLVAGTAMTGQPHPLLYCVTTVTIR
jgi:hypothetical protein